MTNAVLRPRDIPAATGLSERTVRRLEEQDAFPKRILLSPNGRSVGWRTEDVEAWLAERVATSQAA